MEIAFSNLVEITQKQNQQNLKKLKSGELNKLNIEVKKSYLKRNLKKGIF